MDWKLQDRNKAFFHWDLLDQANSAKLKKQSKDQILAEGQKKADNRETTMFWINQVIHSFLFLFLFNLLFIYLIILFLSN
jgi:hypothetical protein